MLAKIKQTYLQFGFNIPLLIAFFLPFGINYGIFIIIWTIAFFAFEDLKTVLSSAFKNKWIYVLLGFFFLHAIGFFFSTNKVEALTAIEIKLSFLIVPILFFATNYNELQIKKILISYVSGCVLAAVMCLFRAGFLYFFQDINAFFYSEFTYFMHPSYFAMYLVFALLIVMLFYQKWLSHLTHLNVKIGFISFLFLIVIFLCSSKMGLITALLLLPTTLTIILFNLGYKKLIVGLLLCLIISISLAYKIFPSPFQRLKVAAQVTTSSKVIDKTDAESTAVRILIWQESVKLIKTNFWLGTTAGDANDKLIQAYQKDGLTGALIKKLNAHNQFLQTFIGTGLLGFILLLMMTIFVMIYGFFKRNYMLVLFSILMICNFLVESMLQAQAGFIFFVFFLCLLLKYNLSQPTKNL
jgi:O-antigen ligase